MKRLLCITALFVAFGSAHAQESDYLVVKKKNGIILKTYYVGGFISAESYTGFRLNGYIKAIRNDSLWVQQEETRLVPTEFGSRLDTLRYMVGLYYNQVRKFNFGKSYEGGRKKGFSQVTLPKLLIRGGAGFFVLEFVNSLYRGESLTRKSNLTTLGIAAGVAATGWIWSAIARKRDQVGGRYEVAYIRANTAIK